MIKQMCLQEAYIVDIATHIGCSESTVRRFLKFPEPPARKTRFKMAKLRPFMDYIDIYSPFFIISIFTGNIKDMNVQ